MPIGSAVVMLLEVMVLLEPKVGGPEGRGLLRRMDAIARYS